MPVRNSQGYRYTYDVPYRTSRVEKGEDELCRSGLELVWLHVSRRAIITHSGYSARAAVVPLRATPKPKLAKTPIHAAVAAT